MADPVSDSLQFWAKLRADQPLRDAQVQAYRDQHDQVASTRQGSQALVKLLASMGALDSQTQPPSPDAMGGATAAQTFPYQTPAPPIGRPMPLAPPAGGAMPSIPAPGQASVPMQAPSPAALLGPLAQAYLGKQPQNAQPAALQVLLANAMGKGATARAPAPNAAPATAPTVPPMGGARPAPMGAPGGAPGGGPAPGVVPSPAPAGWQPLRQPQSPGGASAGTNPDLPLGGYGVEPTKMPSVPVMAKRLLDSGVNPEAAYYALQDYEQIQDKETKQVMDGLKMQASVYRTMLSAGNERMRALASESAAEDRKASLAERTRHDKVMEGRGGNSFGSGTGSSATGLTPEGLDIAAQKYRSTGVMPGLGFSTTAAKLAIINRAAVLDIEEGGKASTLPGRQAEFKANSAALVNVTKDLTAIAPYQQMLETNADIAIDLAKQVTKSDLPIANKSINWVEQNVTGDPTMAEYLTQIRIVQTEAARVLNNPRLVGQLTDSARHEMEGIVNGNLTVSQTVSVLERLKSDGNNRVNAMRDQSEQLRKSLGVSNAKTGASSTAKTPPPTNAKGWALMADKNGNRAYVSPDKKQFEVVQ